MIGSRFSTTLKSPSMFLVRILTLEFKASWREFSFSNKEKTLFCVVKTLICNCIFSRKGDMASITSGPFPVNA